MLADHAQALFGKLYLMGGGWNVIGPDPSSMALAGIIELDWNEANEPKRMRIELLTEDGQSVPVQTPVGERPVQIETTVEVGRPPGTPRGVSFNIPLAINLGPLPIPPGHRYVWRFSIDGESREEWRLPFSIRPAVAGEPPTPN